jgi:hypothetical protein
MYKKFSISVDSAPSWLLVFSNELSVPDYDNLANMGGWRNI